MNSFFNSKQILDILVKWKIHLIAIAIIAALLAVFFSSPFFMTPLYKSYGIVYPSNISPYSDESETEQMVQLFNSKDIRDSVIRKFDLPKHWGIDSAYRYYRSTMEWEWSQRVRISKTPLEAVQIEVLDPDPQIACDMVTAIINYYNLKVRGLHKEKFEEVVMNYNYVMEVKREYLDSLKNCVTKLGMNYGLMQFEAQTREVMRALLQNPGSAEAKRYKRILEQHGGDMLLLSEMIRAEADGFSTYKITADQALLDFNRKYTHANILTEPFPADKKSYPIRWLIVTFSTLAAIFLAILVIGIIENRKSKALYAAGHKA
jgi:hypothetical protein